MVDAFTICELYSPHAQRRAALGSKKMATFDYEFTDLGLKFSGSVAHYGIFSGSASVETYDDGVFEVCEIELEGQAKGDANITLDPCRSSFECELVLELDKALRSELQHHPVIRAEAYFDQKREYGTTGDPRRL